MNDDLIRRQAVLDIDFHKLIHTTTKPTEMIRQKIEQLPPVNPQEPKTGYWDKACKCSECGEWSILETEKWSGKYKYCPNCGCRTQEIPTD